MDVRCVAPCRLGNGGGGVGCVERTWTFVAWALHPFNRVGRRNGRERSLAVAPCRWATGSSGVGCVERT